MKKETKTVVYDDELRLEAYRFEGVSQPFPNHFHEYYVIGCVENGERSLSCKGREYIIKKGNIVVFNPGDNHSCDQSGGDSLYYLGINIPSDVMCGFAKELTGSAEPPEFTQNVMCNDEALLYLRELHRSLMSGSCEFDKEESALMLISILMRHDDSPESRVLDYRGEVEKACAFIEQHYSEHICLDSICRHTGASKSTLLRAFAKIKGVTPYRYLENIRVSKAKKLLEQGVTPTETALRTGFSDQSHFTNYFSRFIGLTPGMYRKIFSDSKDKPYDDE